MCPLLTKVNADIKKYVLEDGVPRLFEVNTNSVGLNISTKAMGSDDREDITDQVCESSTRSVCKSISTSSFKLATATSWAKV